MAATSANNEVVLKLDCPSSEILRHRAA
jgi:hypothetical protein